MGKTFYKASGDVVKIFDELLEPTNLENYITFDVIADNKLKEIYKISKTTDILKFYSNSDVILFVNETIFDELDEVTQRIVIDEALSKVSFDSEKDRVNITDYDFSSFTGIIKKYGFDEISRVKELVKLIQSQKKDQESE